MVNNETFIDSQTFFKHYKNNYSLRGNDRRYTCKYHFNNVVWQFFFYPSVKIWNEVPNELVSCKNHEHFRLKLKKN